MKLCKQCGVNPKPLRCSICRTCADANRAARDKAAAEKKKMERQSNTVMRPCKCGCGGMVPKHRHFTEECAARRRVEMKHFTPYVPRLIPVEEKPVKKRVLITDREQRAIDDEIMRREAARVARIHADMGLFERPGCQLAGECRRLTPEEIEAVSATINPPTGSGKRHRTVNPDKDFHQFNAGAIGERSLRPYSADKCRG